MNQPTNSAASRDRQYHLRPYTAVKLYKEQGPLVMVRGDGIHVFDDTGKEYIDALAGLWCASLGFSEKRLAAAAARQFERLPYYQTFFQKGSDVTIDLAEKLISIAPKPLTKAFFANSGSEANDSAVKLIWYYNNAIGRPKKKKIISRIKGYHGVTVAAASLTGLPNNHRAFDLPIAGFFHTDCPHYWRFGKDGESEEGFATRCAENLEKMILEQGADTVAAFFAEPVMGAGGVILPPRTYFEKIQAVLKKHDVLFVADEVICGFGRTGNMWASQTYNLTPDILICAKGLSSAYLPISAVLTTDKIYDAVMTEGEKIGVFAHGFTYSGHPVSAAVALETLKIYEERKIVDHVREIAPRFQAGLKKFADHPLIGEVRTVGLVGAIEIVKNKKTKESFEPAGKVGNQLLGYAQEEGLITRAMVDSVAFCPPLIITPTEIDEMFSRAARALDKTEAWVKANNLR